MTLSAIAAAANRGTLELGFSEKEAAGYSVARAILNALERNPTGFEVEVSRTLQSNLGRPPRGVNGVFIPTRLRASLDTKTDSSGGYTTQTQVMDLVDAFRSQMRLTALGATFLSGLKFSAQFPVESNVTAAHFVSENSGVDVDSADMSFGAVTAIPKTLSATTAASRQLLQQTVKNVGLERRLRMDLTRSHSQAFDAAAIAGSGTENEPTGVLQTQGVSVTVCGASGALPNYATVCDMAAAVGNADAADAIGWLSTPNIRKLLQKTWINGAGSEAVWATAGILGRPAMVSTAVPSTLSKGASNGTLSAIVCGAWAELLLAEFGVIEIIADEFAQKKRGLVEVTSFSMVDVVIPRPSAFNVCLDAALS